MADMETRLEVFREFMNCAGGIYCWRYDGEMRLIHSTCPSPVDEQLDHLFCVSGCKQIALEACKTNRVPSMVTGKLPLVWLAAPYKVNQTLMNVFVVGPIFFSTQSESNLHNLIQEVNTPTIWEADMLQLLTQLPVVQHTMFLKYGALLHHCITAETIASLDIEFVKHDKTYGDQDYGDPQGKYNARNSYAYEQRIFRAIETGNIHFKHPDLNILVGTMCADDSVRQAKDEIIVFIALATRAAVRGGLPEETAYSLSDSYIRTVEDTDSLSDIYFYGKEAFHDFLQRVYKLKLTSGLSREIQNCLSYIESNVTEKINFGEMAKQFGYNRNYLSAKFKKEMGLNLSDYILQQKLDLSKLWLRNTKKSIFDISQELNFSSHSYFGSLFRKYTGVSPSKYRDDSD